MRKESTMKNTEHDFESVIDRKGTNSLKWDYFDDDLPMWVADMDFKVAPTIQKAILKRANHPIYGYSVVFDDIVNGIVFLILFLDCSLLVYVCVLSRFSRI